MRLFVLAVLVGLFLNAPLWLNSKAGAQEVIPDTNNQGSVVHVVAPQKCIFYLAWTDSFRADSQSQNLFRKFLAEPELREFLVSVVASYKKFTGTSDDPAFDYVARKFEKWLPQVLEHPAAIFVSEVDFDDGVTIDGAIAVELGKKSTEFLKDWSEFTEKIFKDSVTDISIDGATFTAVQIEQNNELIVGVRNGVAYISLNRDSIAAAMKRIAAGKKPKWLRDLQAAKQTPDTTVFIDVDQALQLADSEANTILSAFGLDQIKRITTVSDSSRKQLESITHVNLKNDSPGLMDIIGKASLNKNAFQLVPGDATFAIAGSFEFESFVNSFMKMMELNDPSFREDLKEELKLVKEKTGFDLQKQLNESLGNQYCFFHSNEIGGWLDGFCLCIAIRDRAKTESIVDYLFKNVTPDSKTKGNEFGYMGQSYVERSKFKKHTIHYYSGGQDPDWRWFESVAVCVTDDFVLFGPSPQTIKALLDSESTTANLADHETVAQLLKQKPSMLVYQDSPKLMRLLYGPMKLGLGFALSNSLSRGNDLAIEFPTATCILKHLEKDFMTVQRTDFGLKINSRESMPGSASAVLMTASAVGAYVLRGFDGDDVIGLLTPKNSGSRASINRIRQIAIAMHNYHDVFKLLPPAYSVDKAGKPLLSWRVHLLPFMEHQELYNQFRLDEPWDSEHNKKLIDKMPSIYQVPGSKAAKNKTNYVTFRATESAFAGSRKIGLRDISDGSSNTIMFVEAADDHAVIWTRPDDLDVDLAGDKKILEKLVGLRRGYFLAAFADGSVSKISNSIDNDILKAAITRGGREQANIYKYKNK